MTTAPAVTTEEKIADVMRELAATLQKQYDEGHRSSVIDLDDLTETLLAIADKIDSQ